MSASFERPVRVLMLEDSADDAMAIEHALCRAALPFVAQRTDDRRAFAQALAEFAPDVILTDCVVPGLDVLTALKLTRALAPGVPVIVVTGVLADELIARLLDAGALDYLLKDRLARLGSAVRRACAVSMQSRAPAAAALSARVAASGSLSS